MRIREALGKANAIFWLRISFSKLIIKFLLGSKQWNYTLMKIAGRIFRNRAFLLVGSWKSVMFTVVLVIQTSFLLLPAMHPLPLWTFTHPFTMPSRPCLWDVLSFILQNVLLLYFLELSSGLVGPLTLNIIQLTTRGRAQFRRLCQQFSSALISGPFLLGDLFSSLFLPQPLSSLYRRTPFTITPRTQILITYATVCTHHSSQQPLVSALSFVRPSPPFPA